MARQEKSRSEWVNRYVAEVGRLLPPAKRADVEMEIRSLIEEEVEAQQGSSAAADEETVLGVLHKFGPPRQIAVRYGAQQSLIGPALFPTFLVVMRIVLAIAVVAQLIGIVAALGLNQGRLEMGSTTAGFFGGLLQAFGTVVLVFAAIEYFSRSALEKQPAPAWDPRSLPSIDDRDRVRIGEMVLQITFAAVAIVLINFYLDRVGFYTSPGGQWHSFELFSQEFRRYVPWLTLWWGAELILNVAVLVRGHWLAWMRWIEIALGALGITILYWMLTGPALSAWPVAEPGFRITVGIILIVNLIELGKNLFVLVGRTFGIRGERPAAPAAR